MPRYAKGSLVVGPRCGVSVASKDGTLRTFSSNDAVLVRKIEKELKASHLNNGDGSCKKGKLMSLPKDTPKSAEKSAEKREPNAYAKHTRAVHKCFAGNIPGSKAAKAAYKEMADELTFGQKAKVVAITWYHPDEKPLCTVAVPNAVKWVRSKPFL